MPQTIHTLELLSPAADKHIAIEAILHGADAVYIGAPSHGARKNAANSIDDIRATVEFAHQYRAKIYVTVNTIVYDSELKDVEKMIWQLYHAGVDALIVQDMGILRMNLPPIALHASTQCDIRTPEKALFLQNAGFTQIVLARELSLKEIERICAAVTIPVECFVHGALCVSYSGRCGASQSVVGRSANRGECAQICRLPFDLLNADGEKIVSQKHLLSLRDFNTLDRLEDLINAGVASFKIEGRLKEMEYVKNITATYSNRLNEIIRSHAERGEKEATLRRSSCGISEISFTPRAEKSFNRGFTSYFLEGRGRNREMANLLTPKSMGEEIHKVTDLHNGDGISFFNAEGKFDGVMVNSVVNGKIIANRPFRLPAGTPIYRTSDREWKSRLDKKTASRRIPIDLTVDLSGISAIDQRGVSVKVAWPEATTFDIAEKPVDYRRLFDKFGNTIYILNSFTLNLPPDTFIPASFISIARRELIEALTRTNEATYPSPKPGKEIPGYPYPLQRLIHSDNVANRLARDFYQSHGIKAISPALETASIKEYAGQELHVMTTRYCLRRELGCCLKNPENKKMASRMKEPLTIVSDNNMKFTLDFNCADCEMRLLKKI